MLDADDTHVTPGHQGKNPLPVSAQQTIALLQKHLDEVFGAFDSWFERPPAELEIVPADVGWKIRSILEHVGLVNHYLLLTLRKGAEIAVRRAARQPVPQGESDLSLFSDVANPDSFDWQPPSHMIPTGTVSLHETRERLKAQHDQCRQLLEKLSRGEGLLHTLHMSVCRLGKIDLYQWLFFLLMHGRRHLIQMERAVSRYYE